MLFLRPASINDIERISEIETLCFPQSEAADLDAFKQRFAVFPECFIVIEVDGKVVGHINGCINNKLEITDALFENASLHQPDGMYQTIFGLAVDPKFQHQGYASRLIQAFIQQSKERGLRGIVLTCKEHLVNYYERHGFKLEGQSNSTHGGSLWFDMTLIF
ncbi:GNAT family N-acetyltransferase [Dongshaea marina]|uniref:GNAT family N-acetyltransferase n=1 Tax=Dongshaea marina TaxID=2047966 RepID=UPI000D3E9D0A|nr:GNAT family N-acetyltransferase [Dongshaea marina]